MMPVTNHALQSAFLMSVIMLRGPSSLRPPDLHVRQSSASAGCNLVVRGQGDCHAQLAKINNTANTLIRIHRCTIVQPEQACLHVGFFIVMGHHGCKELSLIHKNKEKSVLLLDYMTLFIYYLPL